MMKVATGAASRDGSHAAENARRRSHHTRVATEKRSRGRARDGRGYTTLSPEKRIAQRSARRKSRCTFAKAEDRAAECAMEITLHHRRRKWSRYTVAGEDGRTKIRMHVSAIEAKADTRSRGRLTRRSKLSRDEGRAERQSPKGCTRSYNKDRDGKSQLVRLTMMHRAARGFAVHARNKKQRNKAYLSPQQRNHDAVKSKTAETLEAMGEVEPKGEEYRRRSRSLKDRSRREESRGRKKLRDCLPWEGGESP
ncbi:hypothetical protein H6P81_018024 [Aristolochia fimbriata]|uniref:Uncharacterized protein n=1 Tax=Aristolochia fimbriata TaxID=158543 RepID=A0AAV7DZT8_ARIFI|nr:hypothetical protein H6P81_018024 [Aristolochia fimbriata]